MPDDLCHLFQNPWFYIVSIVISYLSYKVLPILIMRYENRRLEIFRRELLRREKADSIADLLIYLSRPNLSDSEKDTVDKILYQLCLTLPPCLIHKMAHSVCRSGEPEDVGPYGILIDIKDFIEGRYKPDKSRKLLPENIPHTTRKAEQYGRGNE